MIKYSLMCAIDHGFEAWFPSSGHCQAQLRDKLVECPVCLNTTVRKAPMAPSIVGRGANRGVVRPSAEAPPRQAVNQDPAQLARAARRFIETHGESVGPTFAKEARRIDRGDAPSRLIYGDATDEERQALQDDDIPVGTVPWVPLDDA